MAKIDRESSGAMVWLAVLLLLPFVSSYYYNQLEVSNFEGHGAWSLLQTDMMEYDEAQDALVMKAPTVVGVYTPVCQHYVDSAVFQGLHRLAGPGTAVASVPVTEGFPYVLDECAEVFYYDKGASDPRSRTSNFDYGDLIEWIGPLRGVEVRLENAFDHPVVIYHSHEDSPYLAVAQIEVGGAIAYQTAIGYSLMAKAKTGEYVDPVDNATKVTVGGVVDYVLVDGPVYRLHPNNRLNVCEKVVEDDTFSFSLSGAGLLPVAEGECASIDDRFTTWYVEHHYRSRVSINFIQSHIVRRVTEEGFALRRLPEGTLNWLKEYFYETGVGVRNSTNNILAGAMPTVLAFNDDSFDGAHFELSLETDAGTCLNQDKVPTEIKPLTNPLKNRLDTEVRPIFEDWFGGDLVRTSIYGVRRYREGALLRMHVDTLRTHVVSAIINVGQSVASHWPLVILDHDGLEHNIVMQPGDLLLYESAKLVHGRPTRFKGDYYDNIFIHYMPVVGWEEETAFMTGAA